MLKFIVIVALVVLEIKADAVDTYIALMEQRVNGLAEEALKQFRDFSSQCIKLSYNQCQGTSNLKCYSDFPERTQCSSSGARLAEQSAIRLAPGTDENNLNSQQKHIICSTAKLQTYFESLDAKRDQDYLKAYIGTSTGMFRSQPTIRQDGEVSGFKCTNYDPRLREWYTHAVTGNKNIILMIDNSGTLREQLATLKIAAQNLVRTFITNDTIGVFAFNGQITHLSPSSMVKATQTVREQTINKIQNLAAGNFSNYTAAFQRAFEMLETSNSKEELCCRYSPTDVVFVMFTDQSSIDSQDKLNTLKTYINGKLSGQFKIQLFIYSFLQQSNQTYLSRLACSFRGQNYEFVNGASEESIREQLQKIYSFMGKDQDFSKASWAELYTDAFGFGRVTTVTRPIYYSQANYLIGVVGIDSPVVRWLKFDTVNDEDEISRRILKNNRDEYTIKSQSSEDCSSNTGTSIQFKNITGSVFREPETTATSLCCGLSKGALAGIIVGSVGGVAIIAGVAIFLVRKKYPENKTHQPSNLPNINPSPNTQNTGLEGFPPPSAGNFFLPKPPSGFDSSSYKQNL